MSWNYRTILVIVIAILLSSSFVHAQKQSWNLNFKGGILLPGTVTVEGYDGDTELGWIVNTAFDGMVAESFRWVAISFIPEPLRRKPVNPYPQILCPSVGQLKAGFSYEAALSSDQV